jgi:hypothetical protein
MEVTTSCARRAVPAADLRFGGVVGPSWVLRAADDLPHDASELPGGNTGRCGAGSRQCVALRVLGVCWGDSECQNAAFWHLGSTGEQPAPSAIT